MCEILPCENTTNKAITVLKYQEFCFGGGDGGVLAVDVTRSL